MNFCAFVRSRKTLVPSITYIHVFFKYCSFMLFIPDCLVSNLVVELYFLMQLLTAKGMVGVDELEQNKTRDIEDINYLCTIHNCVHFAVTVLHKQLG